MALLKGQVSKTNNGSRPSRKIVSIAQALNITLKAVWNYLNKDGFCIAVWQPPGLTVRKMFFSYLVGR